MEIEEIKRQARGLFARKDILTTELGSVQKQLSYLRLQYMQAERTCGLDEYRFKKEVS